MEDRTTNPPFADTYPPSPNSNVSYKAPGYRRDPFLDPPPAAITGLAPVLYDLAPTLLNSFGSVLKELAKLNPSVLCLSVLKGSVNNTIPAGDTSPHRLFFEEGGKSKECYKTIAYSNFDGVAALGIVGTTQIKDGIKLANLPIILHVPLTEVLIITDGSNACPINASSDPTHGGIYVYAFTIPEFDQIRDQPLPQLGSR